MSSSTASKLAGLIGADSARRAVLKLASAPTGVHAVLLYGAAGSGKNVLAGMLAQAWLCREPNREGACGTCRPCGAFERGTSADLLRIVPSGPSRIIGVKAITNDHPKDDDPTPVLTFFRTLPLAAGHKVVLIEAADRMNNSASNALLKTLEEPHPHAKLILTTDTVGAMLATVLSRCVAIACEAPGPSRLAAEFPQASADEIRISEGTPGRLRHILHHREVYGRAIEFGRELLARRPGEALVASDALRQIAEALDRALGCGARAAQAEVLQVLAIFLAREPGAPTSWAQTVAESHRRIMQNGQAGLVFDALMTNLLARR